MSENLDKDTADVVCNVSAKDVKESNLVLRKFYDEISKEMDVAWNYCPFRVNKTIFIGFSTFGKMWLDYNKKGQIKNLYIATESMELHNIVKDALEKAVKDHDSMITYYVGVEFETNDICFQTMCKNDIKVETNVMNNRNITVVKFAVKAFGDFDLKYIVTQKVNYLKHLMCVYTNCQFEMHNDYFLFDSLKFEENDWENYDYDWMDEFYDEVDGKKYAVLLPDFFDMYRVILDNDSYNKTIRLLLNSAQEIYCGKLMIDDVVDNPKYNIPGFVDIVDTVLISALEPLSNIGSDKPENCPICGNLKYKIRYKVKDLCEQYVGDYLTKKIADIDYGRRSDFLHEGHARTNEFYMGRCVPQINTSTGNSMLNVSYIDLNLLNYATYIFRKKLHDVLKDEDLLYS